MQNKLLTFRKYEIGDEVMIAEFRKLFPLLERRKSDPAYYLWKYSSNPVCEPEVWLAEDENKIVGLLVGIPKRVRYKGRTLLAAELGDAFVLREYQGGIVFKTLVDKVFAGLERKGIKIIYGVPNDIALPSWKRRFKMATPFSLVKLARVLRTENLIRKKIISKRLISILASPANLAIKVLNLIIRFQIGKPRVILDKIDTIEDEQLVSFLNCFDFNLEKSREYLRWRYLEATELFNMYRIRIGDKILGITVTTERREKGLRTGYIVDLMLTTNVYSGSVIDALIELFDNKSLDIVLFWTTRNNFYYKEFQKKLFLGFLGTAHFILKNNLDEEEDQKYDFSKLSYYLNIGDTDNI